MALDAALDAALAADAVGAVDIQSVLVKIRIEQPNLVREVAERRLKRVNWQASPLMILAVDHPARRVTSAGGNAWAMANRADLLRRTLQILALPGVDGLLATPDIMEEIILLNHFIVENGGVDCLSSKVLIGSMNRSGLANTAFELNDFITGYTAQTIQTMNLDAGKFLLRLNPQSEDSGKTLQYCVNALEGLAERGLPVFLEPLAVPHSTDDLVRLVGVASALGSTSMGRWLKLPMTEQFERVAVATTCPIVLLGGDNAKDTDELTSQIESCFQAGRNVRGLMIGRSVLYPKDGADFVEVAARLADLVHQPSFGEV